MAEKSGKKKTKKAAKAETGVLGNLSATRPSRLGGDRRGSSRPAAAASAKTATAAKPAAAKPKASRAAAAKPTATKTATAAKPAAAKPKTVKPKVRTPEGTAPKPPSAPPAGWQAPGDDGRQSGRPGATELVSTTVQAAGEIAQIGLTVGGQILKRAAGRIPRP